VLARLEGTMAVLVSVAMLLEVWMFKHSRLKFWELEGEENANLIRPSTIKADKTSSSQSERYSSRHASRHLIAIPS
jgi:hypothetical protein